MGHNSILRISLETRARGRKFDERIASDVESVRRAINRLDGKHATVLTLDRNGNTLFIGGGPDLFSVTTLAETGDSYNLVGDPGQAGTESILLGGQRVDWPRRYLVAFDKVLPVISRFLESGQAETVGDWEK